MIFTTISFALPQGTNAQAPDWEIPNIYYDVAPTGHVLGLYTFGNDNTQCRGADFTPSVDTKQKHYYANPVPAEISTAFAAGGPTFKVSLEIVHFTGKTATVLDLTGGKIGQDTSKTYPDITLIKNCA